MIVVELVFEDTRTPRQKRCGSRISSSAEKLLEWPLCGVADKKSRCSKRGAMSRIPLSDLGIDSVAGAAGGRCVMRFVEDRRVTVGEN